MEEADAGGEPVARVSFGGMYSAKTDELLEIAMNSQHRLPGVTVISPFIAGVMDEKYIMSRRGGK
jgi:thymidine kinase